MKKFLIKLSYTVLPLWLVGVVAVMYHALVVYPNKQGDFGGLGKIPTRLYYEKPTDTMPPDTLFTLITELEDLKNVHADVLVCGDSFSRQMPYGYVNYLAHAGWNVANFPEIGGNPFQRAWDMMNLEYVDADNAPTLFVESVERHLVSRLLNIDFQNDTLPDINKLQSTPTNEWALLEAKNMLELRMKGFFFEKTGKLPPNLPLLRLKLSEDLFSSTHATDLYVYIDDVTCGFSIEDSVKVRLKQNVDALFAKAHEKHINLLILVCPDRYDLYQEYIAQNPFPPKTVNEDFRRLMGDTPNIVIGKELLLPHLHAGEKDLYYWDDTHWSYKSAKIVADTLSERLNACQGGV